MKLKEIEWFGLFFIIESKETQRNIMVWVVVGEQKLGDAMKSNGLAVYSYQKPGNSMK